MRKLTLVAVVLMVCSLSMIMSGWSAARLDAQPLDRQIAIASFADSPLTMTEERVLSVQRPVAVAFAVTNVTNRFISDYDVRVYLYRSNGRPMGVRSTRQNADLRPGTEHADLVSLASMTEEVTLEPGAVVVITVTAVVFEDGSYWRAPQDYLDRVKAVAARLTGGAAP